MISSLRTKLLCGVFLWVIVQIQVSGQGIYIDLNSIPKAGTTLIYAHQDDDLIWMLPWWNVTEKFIGGAMPPTSRSRTLVHQQQQYMDSNGYGIDYEHNWITPWADITDNEYSKYYWSRDPEYNYLALDHLEAHSDLLAPMSVEEVNKLKAKIEQYIASPSVSRIITHNIWGEYGHYNHVGVDIAVRELAVKYRKDVWMLGCDNGEFIPVDIPPGMTYTTGSYDTTLFARIRNIYKANYYWTWDDNNPTGPYNYLKIVDGGNDLTGVFTGEQVTTPGPYQDEPGAYIFDGIDDYMTLAGNNNPQFTISMRIRPDVIQIMDISKMSEYPSAPSCDRSFYLDGDGHLTARIFDGQSRTVTSALTIASGTWTDIVMTGDGSTLKLYINGNPQGSVPAGIPATYSSPEFVLGQAQETTSFFKGQISDVKFFDHALTQSEIAALTNSLTVSGVTVYDKVYDRTVVATLNTGGASLVGVDEGDDVTLLTTGATGSFADRNVGSGKIVTISGFTLLGSDASKYSLIQPSLTADITPDTLFVTGLTASDKVYDGTAVASLNTEGSVLYGVFPGDNVSLVSDGAEGTFSDKNVGSGKIVSASGFTITGTRVNNYILKQPSTLADITPAGVTISGVTASDKVYDRTIQADLNTGAATPVGVLGGDDVNLISSGVTGTFADRNVGTNIQVMTSGFVLSGTDADNYVLTQPSLEADITPKKLTIEGSFTVSNKEYDGSASATIVANNLVVNTIIDGDDVSLTALAVFSDANVGTGKTVTLDGSSLTGTKAFDYYLSLTGAPTTTADIFLHGLTVTGVTANNKMYDGTTEATLNIDNAALEGILGADIVSLASTGATGKFADKNVGADKLIIISGFTLAGSDAEKYTLIQPTAYANITSAGLTISGAIATDKVYDGTTSATINAGNAILIGGSETDAVELVTSDAKGTFVNSAAGTGISVITSGFSIIGADALNYTLTQPSLSASITPATVTITGISAGNKVYDGTAIASLSTGSSALEGVLAGDDVSLDLTGATGSFSDRNAGTEKIVSIFGVVLTGTDASDYVLAQNIVLADITPVVLTISGVTAENKIYDALTSAILNKTGAGLDGVLPGDLVSLTSTGATGNFVDKYVGTGKEVIISGFGIDGVDAVNYDLIQPHAIADILPASITLSGVTANNKAYDGTASATLNTENAAVTGAYGSDHVVINSSGAAGVFTDEDAGSSKSVNTSGFLITGPDAINYTLIQPALTADIAPAQLTVSGITTSNKIYDGTTVAVLNTEGAVLNGILNGDIITLISTGASGSFTDKNAGTGKMVTTNGLSLEGEAALNYILTGPNLTADIMPKPLTVYAKDLNKYYGSTLTFTGTEITAVGLIPGDAVNNISFSCSGAFSSADAGTYPITITAGSNINYLLDLVNGSLEVLKAPLIITADDKTRIYEQANPDLTISYSGFVSGQGPAVLDVLPVAVTEADTNSNAGIYDITVSEGSDQNYDFIYNKGTLTINKADQVIAFEKIPSDLKLMQGYQLVATASSGLPVSFEVSDPGSVSLTDNMLIIKKEGDLVITALQEGSINWNPAPSVPQSITVRPEKVNIPSLITPNHDGRNDSWDIPGLEQYGKVQVTIYNRYGQTVYQSDNYMNSWDGTWNGNDLPSASYYYIIKSSTKGIFKGVINIIR